MTAFRVNTQRWLDGLAISASALCLIHCLAPPLLVALMPALSQWLRFPDDFHLWVVLTAIPMSTVVLWRYSLLRGSRLPFITGVTGLVAMGGALWLEGSVLEPWVTSAGSLILAAAHLLNWRGRRHWHG